MSFLLRPWREHLPQFVNLISPACALREHRNDMRVVPFLPVCASGEHKRTTAFVFPLPAYALREHGSVMRIRSLPSSASGAPRSKSDIHRV
jgi:hypothetical protein